VICNCLVGDNDTARYRPKMVIQVESLNLTSRRCALFISRRKIPHVHRQFSDLDWGLQGERLPTLPHAEQGIQCMHVIDSFIDVLTAMVGIVNCSNDTHSLVASSSYILLGHWRRWSPVVCGEEPVRPTLSKNCLPSGGLDNYNSFGG